MDEQEFRTRSNEALDRLYRKLSVAADRYEFEPDFNSGALSVEFEEPKARFVVSPNAPVRQIWVSAHSRSFKLEWNAPKESFILPDKNQTLEELMAAVIGQQVGEDVTL